jgi:hypothetical protein
MLREFFYSGLNGRKLSPTTTPDTREGGYPVRSGLLDQSPASLDYWIIRFRG